MQDILLIDWIAIGFLISFSVVAFGLFVLFTSTYLKSKDKTKIQLAFLIFFLCMGIARIFIIHFSYFLTHLDPTEYSNHQLFWKMASIFQLGGIGGIIFASENSVFKGKDFYGFFIGFIIVFCIAMLHPDFATAQTLTLIDIAILGGQTSQIIMSASIPGEQLIGLLQFLPGQAEFILVVMNNSQVAEQAATHIPGGIMQTLVQKNVQPGHDLLVVEGGAAIAQHPVA